MHGLLLAASLAIAAVPPAEPGRRVYDLAGVLGASTRAQLEEDIAAVERETSAEVAVVTVTSLEGETVERYANRLFNAWGIGRRGRNNGVLFLIAPSERRARIEVGYGLEPLLWTRCAATFSRASRSRASRAATTRAGSWRGRWP